MFTIQHKLAGTLARTGVITTPHGVIDTPAFIAVGTKGTVKALTTDEVRALGAQAVLANTYHLYLQPSSGLIKDAGGLHKFMNWDGPMFTDSGGFQVFSLGAAAGRSVSKVAKSSSSLRVEEEQSDGSTRSDEEETRKPLMKIDEDGVSFQSHIDGSSHRFTPEKSMEIQHDLGADIIFAFDECTSPQATEKYQRESVERTHNWAKRSLLHHKKLTSTEELSSSHRATQSLFGIVQGGRIKELRQESARIIGGMDFDGFGIGGSFDKDDMGDALRWVNEILPEEKPRHLLGIGEPLDILAAVENGIDTFDCVLPTRFGRNGTLLTKNGRISIENAGFRRDFTPIEPDCDCDTCKNYTKAYLHHLFRAHEMLAGTLATIHNLHFMMRLMEEIRMAIANDSYKAFYSNFEQLYR